MRSPEAPPAPEAIDRAGAAGPRALGIALLGLGNVGGGVVKLLAENAAAIEARLGAPIELRALAVRDPDKPRVVALPRDKLAGSIDAAIAAPGVDVVCELIGGTTDAKRAVLAAIAAGKHVVTANKALLAEHGAELFAAADRAGVDIYYEAAVCGGVPIIRILREGLASDRVESLTGIVNGTSNFILSTMTAAIVRDARGGSIASGAGEAGANRAFADVLREAQALGYAEADPALDVSGGDAAHKLAILIALAFGTPIDVARIATEGIERIEPIDLAYAARFGYVIKPLAFARDHGGAIEARVHPALVPARWLLADVAGAKNAVYVRSYALGGSMYYGAGAGMLPTAMSVVSDLIDLGRSIYARAAGAARPRRPPVAPRPIMPIDDVRGKFYVRFAVVDRPGVLGQLMTTLGAHGVSIAQVVQEDAPGSGAVPVVALTHEAREGDLRAALADIDRAGVAVERARVIRIAG